MIFLLRVFFFSPASRFLCQAEEWQKARLLAKQAAPELYNRVEEAYNQDLINKQNGDELIRRGNVNTALDMFARNGEWDRCLDLALKSAPKALPAYLAQYSKFLARDKDFLGACQAFVKYGAPRDPANYPLYKLICSELYFWRLAAELSGYLHLHIHLIHSFSAVSTPILASK